MATDSNIVVDDGRAKWSDLWLKEDYWAIWIGFFIIIVTGLIMMNGRDEIAAKIEKQNAIIAAPREQMLGATLYMVCVDPTDGSIVPGTTSCMMCKRVVINAGISTVIVRDDKENFRIIDVQSWIDDDDSLSGQFGY